MKITRATDYAIRCVYCLAQQPEKLRMVEGVAQEMEIPPSFLAKIVQKLVGAGIVESRRGVKGGFRLARSPGEITIHDVVVAIDGPVAMNVCTVSKDQCSRSDQCPVHPVWVAIRRDVEEILKSRKFSEFL